MTARLIGLAGEHWTRIDGHAAVNGVDPMELPIDRFLSLVYHFATDGAQAADIDKFDARLWMPPKGEVIEQGPWSAQAETQAFQAFKAEMDKGKAPAQ